MARRATAQPLAGASRIVLNNEAQVHNLPALLLLCDIILRKMNHEEFKILYYRDNYNIFIRNIIGPDQRERRSERRI